MLRRMELFEALGPAIARDLSDRRNLLPVRMIVSDGAAEQLASALRTILTGRRAAVLCDQRTRGIAGEACAAALRVAGFSAHRQVIPDRYGHPPVCDDVTKDSLVASLPEVDVVIGVGSGVMSDLAKWVAFERGAECAVLATAASMNGYAAANVAPAIAGVKTLVHARAHRVIAADPKVLAEAPFELTSAGLGDVIAKMVSSADWKMNDILFGEDYREPIANIFDHIQDRFLAVPEKIAARDSEAIVALFEALVFSGCAMTLQGSSLPASGGEHLISHTLDMRADVDDGTHDLHGRQVGIGTIFAAALYERIVALPAPTFSGAALPLDVAAWGKLAGSIADHHKKQTARLAEAARRLSEPGVWTKVRDTIAPALPRGAWIKDVLRRAGASHRIADIGVSREHFVWTVKNCAQIRERFTSMDLAWATGVLPDAIDPIIDTLLIE
jgi:glycerol-1-phosphate dehydrogenase [NAD(P)+]